MSTLVMKGLQKSIKRVLWLCLAMVMLGVSAGCSNEPAGEKNDTATENPQPAPAPLQPEFRSMLPQEAFAFLENQKNVLVVDVRTPEERQQLRIPGSVAVPLTEIMQGSAQLPKDKPLLLVCAVGGRSYAAGLYLVGEKYQWVYNLRGGIAAWEKDGLPLEHGKN